MFCLSESLSIENIYANGTSSSFEDIPIVLCTLDYLDYRQVDGKGTILN